MARFVLLLDAATRKTGASAASTDGCWRLFHILTFSATYALCCPSYVQLFATPQQLGGNRLCNTAPRRYNCWRDQSDLQCQELIDKYEEAYLGLSQPEVVQCVLALVLSLGTAGAIADGRVQKAVEVQGQGLHSQLQGLDSVEAVRRLMSRQQLEGQPQDFVPGYEKELQHMLDRRLRLLGPEEEARVRQTSPIVSTL